MTRVHQFVVPTVLTLLAATLAGCAGNDDQEDRALSVRQTTQDSLLILAVDSVSSGFTYGDLLILVDNEPWKFGSSMDAGERLYEVDGKDVPSDLLVIGDVIRIPVAGSVSIELRHADEGESLQQLDLTIPDNTAPTAPDPVSPARGGSGVSRQPLLRWAPVTDPSHVTYELEYRVIQPPLAAPERKVTGLMGTSYSVPKSQELLPGATYSWHVRAIDGLGNVGDWSDDWEFQTTT